MTIIPINLAVATNGFFAGVEIKSNSAIVRAYRLILEELTQSTVDQINEIVPHND